MHVLVHIQWCASAIHRCLAITPPDQLQVDIFVTLAQPERPMSETEVTEEDEDLRLRADVSEDDAIVYLSVCLPICCSATSL